VTHQPAVPEVPGSIPGSGKDFNGGGVVVVILHFCPKNGLFVIKLCYSFSDLNLFSIHVLNKLQNV